jgi:predicted aspartyl protease
MDKYVWLMDTNFVSPFITLTWIPEKYEHSKNNMLHRDITFKTECEKSCVKKILLKWEKYEWTRICEHVKNLENPYVGNKALV